MTTPSPEAIEAAARAMRKVETDALGVVPLTKGDVLRPALDAAYAVDMPNMERPLANALREQIEALADEVATGLVDHAEIEGMLRGLLAEHTQEPTT
jgi:hypothetical protein